MAPLRFVETIDIYWAPTLGIVGTEKQEHLGLQGGIRGGLAEGEDMERWGGPATEGGRVGLLQNLAMCISMDQREAEMC